MKPIGNALDHYWRVIGMANATNVNLVEAMDQHRLSQKEWADMVNACRHCDWVTECDRLLSRSPDLQDAPHRCANCFRFAELSANQ